MPQHSPEAGRDVLRGDPVEPGVLVLQAHPQVGGGVGRHHQRVVGAGQRADTGDGDARGGMRIGEADAVDRKGLEDDDAVEEVAQSGRFLDVDQPVGMVVKESGLPGLEVGQQPGQGVLGRTPHAYRNGVDEQTDHGIGVRDGGGTAGHSGAEHQVLASRQLSQHDRPSALHHGVKRDAQLGSTS